MEFHKGRLVDHIHLRVRDLQISQRFYEGVLKSLGRDLTLVTEEFFIADELFVSQSGETPSRIHLAFQAEDQDQVHAFHRAALAHGGTDNGGPGERPYHPGYFAAYALDPDGNNIEAVYHGPAERSAVSVVLTVT
ncbi:MAG: VOC family protein [Ruegeria sp.]|uniref:VOC family protein n=1 Tax=Ruegeria sp. TaxID=1879320 RepID=UPI00349EFED1